MAGVGDFLSELGRQAPHIALSYLAARKGGPLALAAFEGGLLEAKQRREAQSRQTQLDEERRQLQAAQEERAVNADARAEDAATRAQQAADFERLRGAMNYLGTYEQQQAETAPDPVAAENAMLGRATALEGAYGLKSGQLSPFIPAMTSRITRGVKADAETLIAKAETELRKTNDGAVVDDATVTFQWPLASPRLQRYLLERGHPEGQPFKPSTIRELAASVIVTAPKKDRRAFQRADNVTVSGRRVPANYDPDTGKYYDLAGDELQNVEFYERPDRDTDSERRQAGRDEERRLDEEVEHKLLNPNASSARSWTAISRAYSKLGVNLEARRSTLARDLERGSISRGAALGGMLPTQRSQVTPADVLVQQAEDAYERELAAEQPQPSDATPPQPAPTQRRSATRAQVEAVARSKGVSFDVAKRELESRGVVVE